MRRFLAALLVVILFVAPCFSQINLKLEDRIANIAPDKQGYCAWCCLESLGRHHGIKSLYGLKDHRTKESDFKIWDDKNKEWIYEPYVWIDHGNHKEKVLRNLGDYLAMKQKLDEAGVLYKIQESGIYSRDLIKYSVKNKLGCMIVVKNWYGVSDSTHAVVIQDCDDDTVLLFDPNDIKFNYRVTWEWMLQHWTGYVLVILGVK